MGPSSFLISGYRSYMRSRFAASIAVAALVLAACSSANPSSVPIPAPLTTESIPTALQSFYRQQLKWTDCGGAQCTKITVPLDYLNPGKATTQLNVVKVAAQGDKLGSLFVNPGGPGGSGFDYAKSALQMFTNAVTDNFDVIGVDPRGVATSDPIQCLTDQQIDVLASSVVMSITTQQRKQLEEQSRLPAQGCGKLASPNYAYMSTENVARDFDIARAVVGEQRFNYLGKSYGTAVGTKYAELFPSQVGRMVLDGVLPTDLTLDGVTQVQALGFEQAFVDFVIDCGTHNDCPYQGSDSQVAQKLRGLFSDLDKSPIKLQDGRELTGAFARSAVLSYLYFPVTDYPKLRDALNQLVNESNAAPLVKLSDERSGRQSDGQYRYNSFDSYFSVTCLDRQFRQSTNQVASLAKAWAKISPTFGENLAWGILPCSNWPATAAGPAKVKIASSVAPILLVSRTQDPATPVQWAKNLQRKIPNSGLIIWDSQGHTAYHQGSSCIDRAVDTYLLRGTLPLANTQCSNA